MGFTPTWAGMTSLLVILAIALFTALHHLAFPSRRYLTLVGIRHSLRSPGELVATAAPTALLVAVIFSSLSVGDGLYQNVEDNVLSNLSSTDVAIDIPGGMEGSIWDRTEEDLSDVVTGSAAVLFFQGWVGSEEVTIFGIEDDGVTYGGLESSGDTVIGPPDTFSVYVNEKLSDGLEKGVGDKIRVEIEPPTGSVDSLLTFDEETVALNLTVDLVVDNRNLARYREDSKSEVPPILFVNLGYLQNRMEMEGRINKVLVNVAGNDPGDPLDTEINRIKEELDSSMTMKDSSYRLIRSDGLILKSRDHFFDPDELDLPTAGLRSSSYFADSFVNGSSDLSYPVISALTPEWFMHLDGIEGPEKGEVIISNWTADALNVTEGDQISLSLRRMDKYGKLERLEEDLEVGSVVSVNHMIGLSNLVPDIPGVTDAESCSDWNPDFEADLSDLQQEDIDYWEVYGATPKAILLYDAGVKLWAPPDGNATAIWFPPGTVDEDDLTSAIDRSVDTSLLRIGITPVKYGAMQSSRGLDIFPGMFLTFGIVIMTGSLLTLAGVVRSMSLKRSRDWSILKGLGTKTAGLVRTGLSESGLSLLAGLTGGVIVGIVIGAVLNRAISTIWSRTVEGTDVPFTLNINSILVAVFLGTISTLLLVFFSVLREARKVPGPNVARGDASVGGDGGKSRLAIAVFGIGGLLVGMGVLLWGSFSSGGMTSAITFVMGGMITSSGASLLVMLFLTRAMHGSDLLLYVSASLRRRPGKTPITVAVLSMAICVALSLTAMGEIMEGNVLEESGSYGGGFDFTVDAGLPLDGDLDEIREGLPEGNEVIPILSLGTEGGRCSNINAPFPPRLLGLPGEARSFEVSSGLEGRGTSEVWSLMDSTHEGRIPIVVDYNTLTWIYFEELGSVFTLEAGNGSDVELVVVGILEPSVLTGTFVMSENHLKELFPVRAQYTYFLVRGDEIEEETLQEAFSEKRAVVESVPDQAKENLRYERSYLYLFREFMIFGLVVAMASSVAFTYARSVEIRPEMEVLRAVGVKRMRAGSYFTMEGLGVYLFSISGAAIGSAAAVILYAGMIAEGDVGPSVLLSTLLILIVILITSVAASLGSAYWATRDYRKRRRR